MLPSASEISNESVKGLNIEYVDIESAAHPSDLTVTRLQALLVSFHRLQVIQVVHTSDNFCDHFEYLRSISILAARDVAQRCKELGITALHIKLRATGDNKTKTPGPSAQSAVSVLARSRMKTSHIKDMTPIPTDGTRRRDGRRRKIL